MASTRSFRGLRIIRFGEFEFDVRAAELRKDQSKIRLQEQPFRILVMLLEHPGEVVLREEIRSRLWPNGTVVEVGHGINAAVQRLREALGDSAENPRYVETLARRGYRFACPVEMVHKAQTEPANAPDSRDFSADQLSGKTIGHYQVLEKLGAGGMGVVYRAQDLKLGRYVALKFLPQELAMEPLARGRFEREARVASALNHPNICTIYGVEECAGQPFIVMELLEGETLEGRLVEGPLPPDKALALAIQMAAALDAAHRKGVVHRDLKPANLLLTNSGLKVLDFGLAKMEGAPGIYGSGYGRAYGTLTHGTREGAVLGTLHYMSPEQVQGKEAGAASDIFSLGAVLYEVLSGRRAFGGDNPALAIAAILTAEPPPLAESVVSTTLDRVLRRCLAKDPEDRWQTARDLKTALEWIAARAAHQRYPEPVPHPAPLPRLSIPRLKPAHRGWMIAGALGVALFVLLFRVPLPRWRGTSPGGKVTRFTVTSPGLGGTTRLNLSPDGRSLAFVAGGRIHVRSLDSSDVRVLQGTEGSGTPFWSPDSRHLAFAAAGTLKLIDAAGGPTRILAPVNTNLGGTWGADGTILIGLVGDGIYRVDAAGGPLTRLTELDRSHDESRHLMPQFLPGGRRFLFLAGATKAGESMLYAGSLNSGQRVPIMPVESNVMFIPNEGGGQIGRLVFVRGRVLMAQSFDAAKLRVEGEAFPVAESVIANNAIGAEVMIGEFSAAGGTLAYRPALSRKNIPVSFNSRPSGLAASADGIRVIQNWTAAVTWQE
jgi:eukaryotic-like serine/threonine-protein kinase